jgi:A/G-specific adenine glycosylase
MGGLGDSHRLRFGAQMSSTLSPTFVGQVQQQLLAWYDRQQRQLPWRGERDPYRIWVSEVMLQQTQVATAAPYYLRFLESFPTVERLAQAELDEVLHVWQGLGYYARARNLHAAAGRIVAEYGSQLPTSSAELRRLPGFGDYTAGAVASIAFGEAAPAVDGNVRRVLARLQAITEDVSRGTGGRQVRETAQALVPGDRPGDFNQALMELGATVCTPQSPRCLLCPLQGVCRALADGLQESLPIKGRRLEQPLYDTTAGVVWREDGLVLICKRPQAGLLGGLWQFPGGRCSEGEASAECLQRFLAEQLGIEVMVAAPLAVIPHAYTHFRIRLHVYTCRFVSGDVQLREYVAYRWAAAENLHEYPFPVTDQKIAEAITL